MNKSITEIFRSLRVQTKAIAKVGRKRNVVLYVDGELIQKSRELGFNLSKIFENHLKMLITQFTNVYAENNFGNFVISGSPGEIRTLVSGSRARHA